VRRKDFTETIQEFIDKANSGATQLLSTEPIRMGRFAQPVLDSAFVFQIAGIGIITLAIILTFQSFMGGMSVATQASQDRQQSQVRLVTNFRYSGTQQNSSNSQLQEIAATPDPVEVSKEVEVQLSQQQEALTKPIITHVVEEGDNVYTIAAQYRILPQQLISRNNLIAPYTIKVGQELVIA